MKKPQYKDKPETSVCQVFYQGNRTKISIKICFVA